MHLRSRQAASQYRSSTTADHVAPRSGSIVSITSGGADDSERTESLEERVAYSKQKGKNKRRRRRRLSGHDKRASKSQIFFGGILTVFLLIFISGVDFQDETKKNKRREQRLATSSSAAAANNFGNKANNNINWDIHPPIAAGECVSDGHCPVHSSCAAPPRSSASANRKGFSANNNKKRNGVCEPIEPKGSPGWSAADSKCLDACLRELQADEHWYHGSKVHVEWSEDYESQGRPKGCLVVYTREKEQEQPQNDESESDERRRLLSFYSKSDVFIGDMPQALLDWIDKRFHHVKRVDPYDATNLSDDRWMAYCTAPCRSHSDCATPNSPTAFVCHDSACVRRKSSFGRQQDSKAVATTDTNNELGMVIVTAATSGYFRGLTNLAASVRYWAPNYRMVVYNLGMKKDQVNFVRSWSNVIAVEWPGGIPDSYPRHVHLGKMYAWKPLIVNETVHKYGAIFWMDAGSTLTGPVDPLVDVTLNNGIMLMKGQDTDMKKSAEATYKWFGYDKDTMQTGPHYSGNTQAFLYPSRYIDTIVTPNAKCALDVHCIAPKGESLMSHRFDQTSISILSYAPKVRIPHFTEYLAAHETQLNPDLSKPSYKFVWTSRQTCKYYAEHDEEATKARRGNAIRIEEKMGFRVRKNPLVDSEKDEDDKQQESKKLRRERLIKQHEGIGFNFGGWQRKKANDAPKFSLEQQIANEKAEMARQNADDAIRADDEDEYEDVDPL